MATLNQGANVQVTINAGEVYRVYTSGAAEVDVINFNNFTSTVQTVNMSGANKSYDFGPYQSATKINIQAQNGSLEYNLLPARLNVLQGGTDSSGNIRVVVNANGTPSSIGDIKTTAITSSRATVTSDDSSIAANNTSSNYTITITASTIPNGIILQQLSTGTVTVAAGAGVTFIGSTLATSSAGQQIVINPTPIANTFNVKVA